MIPERHRAALPPGHWYLVHQSRRGCLVVTVSNLVPPDSELEQELVRAAVRAWRHHQRRGLVLLPAPIAGGGLSWLVRQLRRPTVAASAAAAAAGVALAVVVPIVEPSTRPQGRPVIAAPPVRPARTPGRGTAPHRPARPAPTAPAPQRPVSHPVVAAVAVSTSQMHVDPARLPVRLPMRIPPVHVRPPKVPLPHVPAPPVASPVPATRCRLVRLDLRIVRVCL